MSRAFAPFQKYHHDIRPIHPGKPRFIPSPSLRLARYCRNPHRRVTLCFVAHSSAMLPTSTSSTSYVEVVGPTVSDVFLFVLFDLIFSFCIIVLYAYSVVSVCLSNHWMKEWMNEWRRRWERGEVTWASRVVSFSVMTITRNKLCKINLSLCYCQKVITTSLDLRVKCLQ